MTEYRDTEYGNYREFDDDWLMPSDRIPYDEQNRLQEEYKEQVRDIIRDLAMGYFDIDETENWGDADWENFTELVEGYI